MITFLIYAVIIGMIVWLLVTYLPIPEPIRTAIIVIVAICLLLSALQMLTGHGLRLN